MKQDKDLYAELKKVNKRIDCISDSVVEENNFSFYAGYIIALAFVAVCLTGLFYFNGEVTGFAAFSDSAVKTDSFSVEESGSVYNKIIHFDLEPRNININYWEEPVKTIDLKLTNKRLTDYTILLQLEGPLSSSFSWQGSLVHMTKNEPVKTIRITAMFKLLPYRQSRPYRKRTYSREFYHSLQRIIYSSALG
jgi:hypothetical protein